VQLQTENTTLQADSVDVFFSDTASVEQTELERAVAGGHVIVVQPGRRATGNRAEYFAREGKILLSGGPPTLYDAEKGFTSGQRLTFNIHDDSLRVDGGDESPTLSRHRIAQ
jgi:lipopolysaccharide export system protein LptA